MRFGILLWSFLFTFCLIQFIMNCMVRVDMALIFGTCMMTSLYLFIYKVIEYIKEDFPFNVDIKLSNNTKKVEDDKQ